jgi:outer membrane protein assembly factor BamE (lipoprotein component of BamABCDE complex)
MIDREDELQSIGGRPPGRFRIVVRTGLRSMLLGAVAAAVAACSSKWREHESQISAGMSEAEVLELLGEPSSKVKVPAWGEQAGYVRWQWNDNLSTLATGAMFPDTVPDRVLAVSFDAEGKVTEVVLPRPTGQ